MMPTILLVRHGITEMNDSENERIRGYCDVPISEEGKRVVKQTAKFLRPFPIRHILTSPLQRAIMTAEIIAEETSATVRPDPGLLPWNLGDYMEQPVKKVAPKMDKLQELVDVRAPHGESYREFYERWEAGLTRLMVYAEKHLDEYPLGVVHSRNLLALPSVLGEEEIGDVPVKGGPGPESVVCVYKDGDTWKWEVISSTAGLLPRPHLLLYPKR